MSNYSDTSRDFSRFDAMSTEELEEILRLDAQNTTGNESDTEMILYVMGVLAERRKHKNNRSAKEALESFKQNYYPLGIPEDKQDTDPDISKNKSRHFRWPAVAAAMLALVLVTTMSVQAFGFDLWGRIAKWTQGVFQFQVENEPDSGDPSEHRNVEFDSLNEILKANNIPEGIIPTWLPEGYKFLYNNAVESPQSIMITSTFSNKTESEIILSVKKYREPYTQNIEKGENLFNIYESNGINFYIFSNQDQYRIAWMDNLCEVDIASHASLEVLYQIIHSVKGD